MRREQAADAGLNVRVPVNAGPHQVQVAFLKKSSVLIETHRQPYQARQQRPDIRDRTGAVQRVDHGPYNATRHQRDAEPQRIFACHPARRATKPAARRPSSPRWRGARIAVPATDRRQDLLTSTRKVGPTAASSRCRDGVCARCSRARSSCSVSRRIRRMSAAPRALERGTGHNRRLSHQRSRAGVPAVVLPVEQHSGR